MLSNYTMCSVFICVSIPIVRNCTWKITIILLVLLQKSGMNFPFARKISGKELMKNARSQKWCKELGSTQHIETRTHWIKNGSGVFHMIKWRHVIFSFSHVTCCPHSGTPVYLSHIPTQQFQHQFFSLLISTIKQENWENETQKLTILRCYWFNQFVWVFRCHLLSCVVMVLSWYGTG